MHIESDGLESTTGYQSNHCQDNPVPSFESTAETAAALKLFLIDFALQDGATSLRSSQMASLIA